MKIECLICGLVTNDSNRINGSHLKFRHNLTKSEYQIVINDKILLDKYKNDNGKFHTCRMCMHKKLITEFPLNKNRLPKSKCKKCLSEYTKSLVPKYIQRIRRNKKSYNDRNKDKVRMQKKESYLRNIETSKQYRVNNKDKINSYHKTKRSIDINFKLSCLIRNRIRSAIKRDSRRSKSIELLGCDIDFLKSYLESKFLLTMSWNNYGSIWHIDHIRPCASFDLTDPEQQKICFHYTNLQPLFATTRIIEGIEYIGNLNKLNKIL